MATPKKKATVTSVPKAEVAVKVVKPTDVISVKNTSKRMINTTQGSIESGKMGKATVAETRQLGKFLEKSSDG